jgi:hypothetical protein
LADSPPARNLEIFFRKFGQEKMRRGHFCPPEPLPGWAGVLKVAEDLDFDIKLGFRKRFSRLLIPGLQKSLKV